MARVICTKKNQGHPTNNGIPILHEPWCVPHRNPWSFVQDAPIYKAMASEHFSNELIFYHAMFMAYHGAMQSLIYFGANFHFMELKNH